MRKHWILSCILSTTMVGCTTGGFPGFGNQFAGQPQGQQLAAMQQPAAPQQSWTQKVTSVFKGNSNQPTSPNAQAGNPASDPISLGFASGPPNADLYLSMAKMSDQGGNPAHARSMYHRALTIQPDHLEGMLSLARLEDREGQLDAALHYYKQAVHYHPQSAKAHNDLSLCFARRGQVAQALPPLEQAIRLEPGKQLYRNNIAKVLIELNQLDGAMHHLATVHPPAVAQYNMGVLLHQRNRDQEAASYLTAAAQTDPSLQAAVALLGEISGGGAQLAQGVPAQSGGVMPVQASSPYQTPNAMAVSPEFQTVPAETAQRPVGYNPGMVPPVR
ncbi:MAG: tetratricopeptide repeat protein [Planctomycetota bacterium]